jgi:hypothetical protein
MLPHGAVLPIMRGHRESVLSTEYNLLLYVFFWSTVQQSTAWPCRIIVIPQENARLAFDSNDP